MNRLEWVLGILLVLLLLVVIGVSALLWLQPRTPDVPEGYVQTTAVSQPVAGVAPTSVVPGNTAKIAYAFAQRSVADWYADAVLLDASTTWPQGATETDLRTGIANWGYTFYSPEAGTATLVTVTGDTSQRISESAYTPPASITDAGAWLLDSQQAVQIFLDNGGGAFMRDNGITTLIMQLTTSNPSERMEWFASLISNENGRSYSMRIDATSGDVLETIDTP
ncbi:MAG: hypothetical protein H6660_04555 [Ardenticatenaceae bacterium]|nr:hypothetical protein [Ardenticatenaceae bacterium]